jgi:hypothetical protein
MRRFVVAIAVFCAVSVLGPVGFAGSPHFVGDPTATRVGNSVTVSGKEAGLGDEDQIHIVLTATAVCINGGSKHPKAENKQSLSSEGTFPVQNGKADFTLTITAAFFPSCSPPMTVQFTDVTLTDTTNGLTKSFGTL